MNWKQNYIRHMQNGECVRCGKPDERTRQGFIECEVCRNKRYRKYDPEERANNAERVERENKNKRDWWHMRRDAGLCVQCGHKDARTLNGLATCLYCATRDREIAARNHDSEKESEQAKARREKRIAAGLCSVCGRAKEEPERKMCITCRVKAKYRKARLKREGANHGT